MTSTRRAATLIELMVVVAIVAILASIATVNFIGAHSRAKVSTVLNDLRLLGNGLAAYHIDNNRFPRGAREQTIEDYRRLFVPVALTPLTTPLAYMSSLMSADPFTLGPGSPGAFETFDTVVSRSYVYVHYPDFAVFKNNEVLDWRGYALMSLGPDVTDSYAAYRPFPSEMPEEARLLGFNSVMDTIFDPTNGFQSSGDIARFGGNLAEMPQG